MERKKIITTVSGTDNLFLNVQKCTNQRHIIRLTKGLSIRNYVKN